MRLGILDHGQSLGRKALFAFIQLVTRQPVLDVVRQVSYRPDFYGKPMGALTHEAMRGDSQWSVGDRELMAAYISKVNQSEYCIKAHSATAHRAYQDEAKVTDVLTDLDTATINEPLRATLRLLGKLTREHTVEPDDVREVLATGASRQQIEDALAVCFAFNVIDRLGDTFGYSIASPEAFDAGAKYLLNRGYR